MKVDITKSAKKYTYKQGENLRGMAEIKKLMGSIKLSNNFNYKKSLSKAISKKYAK